MNTKRRSFTRFLSCLLALCLLLSIIPATAESPATPTDLAPVEEIPAAEEQEEIGQTEAEQDESAELEEPEIPESEQAEETDSFLTTLKAGAWVYGDKDCYRGLADWSG